MKDSIKLINDVFSKIKWLPARNVKRGYGSFVTMDFGKDIELRIKTKEGESTSIRGEWHLWIYMCSWRIDKSGNPMAGSDDEDEKIDKALELIENKKLLEVTLLTKSFDLLLEFEDKIKIYLFSINTEDSEQWMLFTPKNKVLVAGPSTKFFSQDADK